VSTRSDLFSELYFGMTIADPAPSLADSLILFNDFTVTSFFFWRSFRSYS